MTAAVKFTERMIGHHLAHAIFNRKAIVVVPNCNWTGSECDILVVTTDLRIIDVEVKVSRADLRADAKKDKWYHWWDVDIDGPYQADMAVGVGGRKLEGSIADFERECQELIAREQRRTGSDTAVIRALCNAVRLAREYTDVAAELKVPS